MVLSQPNKFDIFSTLGRVAFLFSAFLLPTIILFMVYESIDANLSISQLMKLDWIGSENKFGIIAILLSSLTITLASIIVSFPLSLITCITVKWFSNNITKRIFTTSLKVLSSLPSVAIGLWGLMKLLPLIAMINNHGVSLLAGIIVLSLMVAPTMSLILYSSFDQLSDIHISSGLALGLTKSETIVKIILPRLKNVIKVAISLGLARAIGETMAVMMVTGNIVHLPNALLGPIRTLTANIALQMPIALGSHRAALFASGAILMVIVVILTSIFEYQRRKEHEQIAH